MSEEPFVLCDIVHGVATLTLNRPLSRNCLSLGMLQALSATLDNVNDDGHVRVIVIAGAGPAFCAGHDLREMRAEAFDKAYAQDLFSLCGDVMQKIIQLPKPVIARVHGIATAAGCQLVASCDLAIADEGSCFATPGVNIGLFCTTPMVALTRAIPHKHAMRMLLTGDPIDAKTALDIGLINAVVPANDLKHTVDELAAKLTSKSARTLAIGKAAYQTQADLSLAEAYAYASWTMTKNLQTVDAQEGISAFLDKRQPQWQGQ